MQSKSHHRLILPLFLLLFGLILQSCGLTTPAPAATLTLAPSDFVRCPQVTPFPTPIATKPKIIYVLIDRSGSYGAYTEKAADILLQGLILSVEPGDRINLIWLGEKEDDSRKWFVETVPDITFPLLTPPVTTFTPTHTPTPFSTIGTPSPNTTFTVLKGQALTGTAEAQDDFRTVTAEALGVIATNKVNQIEKDINQQQCDQSTINSQNQKLIEDYQAKRNHLVEDFVTKRLKPLMIDVEEGSDQQTHIYNSLYYAARTIRQEKDTNLFRGYYLIILSDMVDAGSLEGEALSVDLTDVHVLMAMVYCKQSIDCQERSNYWEAYFKDRGAVLPAYPVRLVDETTPYVISDFLK